jgi:ABC-type amino acid transport substrate-binding protein
VTEDRQLEVDFCRPHLALALAVVRRADDASSGVSLRGARVGVRRGTTAAAHVNSDGTAASVRLSESNEELYAALRAGEIDAVVDDSPIAQYFSTVVRGLHACGVVPGSDAQYAIMVRKGNDGLRDAIDAVIDEMKFDGTLRAFAARWLEGGITER